MKTKLEAMGHEPNGYGWEKYFLSYHRTHYSDFADNVNVDSESTTCGLYVIDSLEHYRELLRIVSEALRGLAV